jgi:tRNA(Ile)-lysidine synthase
MHPFVEKLAKQWEPARWRNAIVLVAVSGGADSVALLRGLAAVRHAGRGRLVVGHFNHGLRGSESDADAAFVAELSRQLSLEAYWGHAASRAASSADNSDQTNTGNVPLRPIHCPEAEARDDRYRFLRQTAQRIGARYVATGHTADDQAETVLQRMLRGTGLAGLAGIRRVRQLAPGVALIRPLLEFRRAEARAYLSAISQPFRDDSTNADMQFTRNRIRHELLPHLAERYNRCVVEALTRLGQQAAESQSVIESLVVDLLNQCSPEWREAEVTIDCSPLAGTPRLLVRGLLTSLWKHQNWPQGAMTYRKWDELAELAVAQPSDRPATKLSLPGNIRAERRGSMLVLRKAHPEPGFSHHQEHHGGTEDTERL